MRRIFTNIFILLSFALNAGAQGNATLLSVNDGMSQGLVYSILQSRDGYMWFCTKAGLNRYDGYQFKVFTHDPFDPFSLGFNEITSIYEDSRGWLWIGHWAGIDVFEPRTGRFYHLKVSAPKLSRELHSFSEAKDGSIWCKGFDGQLWRIPVKEDLLRKAWKAGQAELQLAYDKMDVPSETRPNDRYFCNLAKMKDGRLLAVSFDKLWEPASAGSQLRQVMDLPKRLIVLGDDDEGRVWFGALESNAVYYMEKSGGLKPVMNESAIIHRAFLDGQGYLWLWQVSKFQKWRPNDLINGGRPLLEFDIHQLLPKNTSLNVLCANLGKDGNFWIGTNGFGVLKLNLEKPKFQSFFENTSQFMIGEAPDGRIFTEDGYYRWLFDLDNIADKKPNTWLSNIGKQVNVVFPFFDKEGNFWFNDELNKLHRIDAKTKAETWQPWRGWSMVYSPKTGKVFSVHQDSLVVADIATRTTKFYPFEKHGTFIFNYHLNQVFVDAAGEVWMSQFGELIRATPTKDGYAFKYYRNNPKDESSLSDNMVSCFAEDPVAPERYIWIGTANNGLNRLDKQTGKFQHFKKAEGLPDDTVYGLLAENPSANGQKGKHVWLSTNRGLCRLNVQDFSVKNFTYTDGLQHNEFNTGSYLKLKDGRMIFGGVNGLTVFHPDSLRFNENLPQTQIVSLSVNNKAHEIPAASVLKLSYDQNFLSIDFAALEFTNPASNQYRYRLLRNGLFNNANQEPWINLGKKNAVQLANLGAGSYTFQVLGSNNDGKWGEKPAELRFVIRPPWWASWPAYLCYALAIGGALYYFNRLNLRQKLERQESLRLRELDEFKNRFFTNITHEFRTPLTVILGMSEQLAGGSWLSALGDEKPAVQGKISMIKRSGENLLRLINQLLDLAKLESKTLKINKVQGDVLQYLRYIAESLHSLSNAQNVLLRVESNPDSYREKIIMDYDPERLLQIVYNLLSNAIKFTPSGGRVDLRVSVDDGRQTVAPTTDRRQPFAVLTVTDNGVGIPEEDLPFIFDRFFQANNLEKAKAGPIGAGGTGIGLALTKELVQAMGGEISVQSELGKGTTFTVRLPIAQSPLTPKGEPHPTNPANIASELISELPGIGSPLRSHDGNPSNLQTPKPSNPQTPNPSPLPSLHPSLLLIEDNPDVVQFLTICLQGHYHLDFAYNGRAGIEKALETVPDLIVSDVMMPEKDGFEVCETLKGDERTSHIPIVLLTAKVGIESRIDGLKRGADAYLAKPFHQDELMVTLRNLLETRRKLQAKFAHVTFGAAPAEANEPALTDMEDAFLTKLKAVVEAQMSNSSFSVEDLCRSLAMSQPQLHRKLTAVTGKNATQFIRMARLTKARELLLSKQLNISQVAFEVGFDDPKYFSRVFAEEFGVAPSKL